MANLLCVMCGWGSESLKVGLKLYNLDQMCEHQGGYHLPIVHN